ncbi:hypothetical protein CN354_04640 [Bacillus cereus]|nr:hypothetical protein CN354_04640 [Bacillus cereus]WJE55115.1 hypothetical protein QRE66_02970 [Bacillus cereus]
MLENSRITTIISISIPVLLILLIVNFINEIILTVFQGVSLVVPLFLCPIGFILAIFSYTVDKSNGAKIGIVLNVLVFLIPFILLIRGTM